MIGINDRRLRALRGYYRNCCCNFCNASLPGQSWACRRLERAAAVRAPRSDRPQWERSMMSVGRHLKVELVARHQVVTFCTEPSW